MSVQSGPLGPRRPLMARKPLALLSIVLLPAALKAPAGNETQVRPVANERKKE